MRNPRVRYVLVACAWLLGLLALPFLPDPAPIHWNAYGQVDGYGSPLVAALLVPAILTGLVLLVPLLPRLDPRGQGYSDFRPTYELFMNVIVGFLLFVQVLTFGAALGWPLDLTRPLVVGLGLLFAVLGNEMGRVQPNSFVGIRTPWTLGDPEIWRRTHRVAGRVMAVAGVVTALQALVVPVPWAIIVAVVLTVGAALHGVWYSYSLARGRA